jgi:hypothetical protein
MHAEDAEVAQKTQKRKRNENQFQKGFWKYKSSNQKSNNLNDFSI